VIAFKINRLYISAEFVDMRKSFDTLADIVRFEFKQDPLSGDAFIFMNKRRNRLKVLWFEPSGFWLFAKRLEKGTFQYPFLAPAFTDAQVYELTATQWQMLLEGIVPLGVKKIERYSRDTQKSIDKKAAMW
jgi:transposase